MTKKRVATIDVAKGIGMIIVVLFHAKLGSTIWTQFHMPLFAFLSGMVYREKNNSSLKQVWTYTKKKIKSCYVPFTMYNLTFLLLHNFFYKLHIYGEKGNGRYYMLKDYLLQVFNIMTMGGGESIPGPMWYLIAMLEFVVLYAWLRFIVNKAVINKNVNNALITFLCGCLMAVGFSGIDLPRMLNRALVLMFYYHLGYMTHMYFYSIASTWEYKIKNIVVTIGSIGVLTIGMWGGADWPTFSWTIIPSGIAGIYLVIQISCWIDSKMPRVKCFLEEIGQNTLLILGTHYLWFKIGKLIQIICFGKSITYLELNEVDNQEFWIWKVMCFLFGIGIPITIIKIEKVIVSYFKDRIRK